MILILWEGTTICVGSAGAACWGQLVCTDLAGGAAASYFSLAWPGCRCSLGTCTKSLWCIHTLVSPTNLSPSSKLCKPPSLRHCQLPMEVCKIPMLNPSAAAACTDLTTCGSEEPPVKLSVIAGNNSKYSGSTIGNIQSTQDASKSWQI